MSQALNMWRFGIYFSQNIKSFISLNIRMFRFRKYRDFWNVSASWNKKIFFWGFPFLKYKKFSWGRLKGSVSRNIRDLFRVSVSWKIFNIRAKKFHFLRYKEFFFRLDFFFYIGLESALGSHKVNYSLFVSLFEVQF